MLIYGSFVCRDRRKLTFYFVAEKRIDFRELVRELFRCVSTPPQGWVSFTDSGYKTLQDTDLDGFVTRPHVRAVN